MWAITPLERALLAAGFGPDSMNAGGLLFGLLSGVLIGLGQLEAGGWAIALSGICDILDGRLARAREVASSYGNFIDSTLDRFVETFAFLGFAVYFAGWPYGPLVVAAGLGFSLLVSYAQARGETVGDHRLGRADAARRAADAAARSAACSTRCSAAWLGQPAGHRPLLGAGRDRGRRGGDGGPPDALDRAPAQR